MEAPATGARGGGDVSRFLTRRTLGYLVLAVLALDVLAYLAVPPAEKGEASGTTCAYPVCFINGNLELPAPHVIVDLDPANPTPTGSARGGLLAQHHEHALHDVDRHPARARRCRS